MTDEYSNKIDWKHVWEEFKCRPLRVFFELFIYYPLIVILSGRRP